MARRTREVETQTQTRRVRRRTGGRRPRQRTRAKRRKRQVRSLKRMKKTIKSVIKAEQMCSENTGTYTKMYVGEIEPTCVSGQENYCWAATRNQASTAPYTVFNMGFYPFSRKKVLDAASVLYNSKAASLNVDATGNFQLEGLKIETLYASYELKIWNYTEFPYEVELWSVENRENTDRHPLDTMSRMQTADEWVTGDPGFTLVAGNQYRLDTPFDLSMIKGLRQKYKLNRVKKGILFPGIAMKHFAKQGAKCYDFTRELLVGADDLPVLPSHAKGELMYFIKYAPVTHMHATATNYVPSTATAFGSSNYGFLVEVKEVFKLFEPAETPDTQHGDKRAQYLDYPATPSGDAPYAMRFLNTGPSFTTVSNPST